MSSRRVSFPNESLILVDPDDNEIGYESKDCCHNEAGLLHRALSVFLFNSSGDLLLQQRSKSKRLWPGYWSNSCCSHPRQGEEILAAASRRTEEELALKTPLQFLFKFQYQASFEDQGSENELCHVFIGYTDEKPVVNENEIMDWKYIAPKELSEEIHTDSSRFTPWFKLEWNTILDQHWPQIEALCSRP